MSKTPATGRLFFLDISGRILSSNSDGTGTKTIVDNLKDHPDGIAVDKQRKHILWTNMGSVVAEDGSSFENDGSIQRCDIDGGNIETIVPVGMTHTPKQCIIAPKTEQLYWCDREGMRVMRSNLDGSKIEILVATGKSEQDMHDSQNWCVGVAVDEKNEKLYWSQKGPPKGGKGRIFRTNLQIPPGETPESRSDIEVLFEDLPEPIDLDFDAHNEMLYWTDRGSPPNGNTVNRVSVRSQVKPASMSKTVLVRGLHEGIGISFDLKNERMYFGDLSGSVYEANLDGSAEKIVLHDMGSTTGIIYVEN